MRFNYHNFLDRRNQQILFLYFCGYIKAFDGNTNRYSIVYHDLNPSIVGRYVRFRPIDWNGEIAMRVELFGCSGNFNGRT